MAARILLIRSGFIHNFEKKQIFIRRYSSIKSSIKGNTNGSSVHQPVADFYAGKSVFITGGTGFIGKMLVEKLLYATKLDKIYLLIRDKKGIDINTRLEFILENPLFNRIKESNPHSLAKVIPIYGDLNLPNLGLSVNDKRILIDKVSVIFHSAATVMYNDPLWVAMKTNFKGTQQVLDLAKQIQNIEAFVHISTSLIEPQRPVLLESIYPPPANLKDVNRLIDEYGDNNKETMKFLKDYPTSYSFSKAMTESYVFDNHDNIPTAIIRPSFVTPTISEPVKGWTDNWYGMTRVIHSCGKGWNVVTHGNGNYNGDLIPVDYVANLTIISAARLQGSKEVRIYNSASSAENPITWGELFKIFSKECVKQGHNKVPYVPHFHEFLKSKTIVNILTVLLQKMPAVIADILLLIRGKELKYYSNMSRVVNLRNIMSYFTCKTWNVKSDRVREEYSKLSPDDQKLFPCDPANIVWSTYIKDYCNGVFKYLK